MIGTDPSKWEKVVTYGEVMAKDPPQQSNMGAVLAAIAHPEEMAAMTDNQFTQFAAANFSKADQDKFATMRQNELTGKIDNGAGSINVPALNKAMQTRLPMIGIDPEPKDVAGRAQLGAVYNYLYNQIDAQQRQTGKKMAPDEVTNLIDGEFNKNIRFTGGMWKLGGTSSQRMLGMTIDDVPADARDQIKQYLVDHGQSAPTDYDILERYWTLPHNAPKPAGPAASRFGTQGGQTQ